MRRRTRRTSTKKRVRRSKTGRSYVKKGSRWVKVSGPKRRTTRRRKTTRRRRRR